ncbi:MAG: ABC transporter permease [Actinomycetota bacterium]
MKGWRVLVSKDWKLIYRNRLLLVVLVVYPFLIMGVIGAAFQESGRPIPLGLVNLDRPEGARVLWWVLPVADPSGLESIIRRQAVGGRAPGSLEEAVQGLMTREADLVVSILEEGSGPRWSSYRLGEGQLGPLVDELEASAEEVYFRDSEWRALKDLEISGGGLLLGARLETYPYLAETMWVEGRSYDSSTLIREFSREVVEARDCPDLESALRELREGRIDAFLIIPPGFVRRLKTLEKVAQVEVFLDQSSLVKAEFAETALRGLLSRVSERVVEEKMQAVVAGLRVLVEGGDFFGTQVVGLSHIRDNLLSIQERLATSPEMAARLEGGIDLAETVIEDIEEAAAYLKGTALPVDLRITSVAGRPLRTRDAVVPSLLALSMLWTGVLCGAILMVLEDEEGMRVRLWMTEMGPLALVGSKLVLAAAIVFTQSTVMLLMAVAIFRTFASNIFLALVTIALASLSCIGMGLVLAAFARQVAGAVILGLLVSLPLVFLTGMIFPLEFMPSLLRHVARALPLTYAVESLSGVMLRGEGAAGVLPDWLALLGFGFLFLGLGSLLARRRG